MNLFPKILIFLGLRKSEKESKIIHKKNLANIIKRKIIHKDSFNKVSFSQPRKITRLMYRQAYHKDLSPVIEDISIQVPKVKLNIEMEKKENSFFRKKGKNILSWFYTSAIFLTLCVQPIYTLTFIIKEHEPNTNFYLSSLFFQLIPPTQYVLALKYFSGNHFESF